MRCLNPETHHGIIVNGETAGENQHGSKDCGRESKFFHKFVFFHVFDLSKILFFCCFFVIYSIFSHFSS